MEWITALHFISEEQSVIIYLMNKNAWIPLYIGKSKNFQSRINEHIEGRSQKTYGMKLRHRDALKNSIQFRVSYSPLNELEDDTLYELVKVIENNVRAIFNPIVGEK
ncbi:GIY-YIG nuclease family protein [Paenibacillus amylolyticus]|uniref:GIY-YIG nuclease family protein n=1 Tax=Paenibacillus amylolyticus TaxID=1451 RepID=UPI000B81AE3D|nr:GIY-YIG nuclease family protein [Paenibacillus amylolyticus]